MQRDGLPHSKQGVFTAHRSWSGAMTKYVGTAKASRARRLPGQSSTDKRVALAMFALTGAHPEAAEPSAGTTVLEAAPEPQCAEVQFTFAVDGTPLGEAAGDTHE